MNEPHYYSRLGHVASTQGGNLPHWSQRCATFVTFRLGDSLPEGKLAQLQAEREEWLKAHPRFQCRRDVLVASDTDGLFHQTRQDAASTSTRRPVASDTDGLFHQTRQDAASTRRRDVPSRWEGGDEQPPPQEMTRSAAYGTRRDAASTGWSDDEEAEYRELFSERIQRWLDAGHGSCILRQAEARQIVEDALRHFADIRYSLYAFVVMPNHVHVLFMPEAGYDGRKIVQGWKSYTAKAINKVLNREGIVWQKESYDRLVRDVEEFNAIRAYIRGNNVELAYDAYLI